MVEKTSPWRYVGIHVSLGMIGVSARNEAAMSKSLIRLFHDDSDIFLPKDIERAKYLLGICYCIWSLESHLLQDANATFMFQDRVLTRREAFIIVVAWSRSRRDFNG